MTFEEVFEIAVQKAVKEDLSNYIRDLLDAIERFDLSRDRIIEALKRLV